MRRCSSASDWRRRAMLGALLIGVAIPRTGRAGTLYDDLGGQPGVERIVGTMVTLALADARIKDRFDNVNTDHLKRGLTLKICAVAGGPCRYTGPSMRGAHRGLDITERQFNALVEDLEQAMEQASVPFRAQNRLLALLAPMERDIVTK